MSEHVVSRGVYFAIFGALMALTILTVWVAYYDLGSWNVIVALSIAVLKGTLVVLYFMHVRYSPRLIWVCSGAATVWLAILILLTFSDYSTRGALDVLGK